MFLSKILRISATLNFTTCYWVSILLILIPKFHFLLSYCDVKLLYENSQLSLKQDNYVHTKLNAVSSSMLQKASQSHVTDSQDTNMFLEMKMPSKHPKKYPKRCFSLKPSFLKQWLVSTVQSSILFQENRINGTFTHRWMAFLK